MQGNMSMQIEDADEDGEPNGIKTKEARPEHRLRPLHPADDSSTKPITERAHGRPLLPCAVPTLHGLR